MRSRRWQAGLAAAMLASGWAIAIPRPVTGQEAAGQETHDRGAAVGALPEAVTTEDAEYCAHLQQKYAQAEQTSAAPAAPEAATLSLEGARMCGHGNTRAGILRLRRALVLMMRTHAAAPDR